MTAIHKYIELIARLATLGLLLFCAAGVAAQSSKKRVASNGLEVRLPVTVLEKRKPVSGLTKEDFRIFENGVRQKITSFTTGEQNPRVFVGLLMDTSPAAADKLRYMKEAAMNFLYTATRLRKDVAAFMTFDEKIMLRVDFTDKIDLLDRAVTSVKETGQQAALYDAIWSFADEKLRNVPGRRVLVIISEGDDDYSRADLKDAIDIAQRTETTVFAISTKAGFLGAVPAGVSVKDRQDTSLTQLCKETGGEAFFIGDMMSVERALARVSQQLNSQYIITYRPSKQKFDGRLRTIDVRLTNRANATKYEVRTKKSYRAIKSAEAAVPRQQPKPRLHRKR